MADKKKDSATAKQSGEAKHRIEKLVDEAIGGLEKRLSKESEPLTIGDYLKVLQLQKEIEEETPKEIKVTWVDPVTAATSDSEK